MRLMIVLQYQDTDLVLVPSLVGRYEVLYVELRGLLHIKFEVKTQQIITVLIDLRKCMAEDVCSPIII